jgi:hypothetical protein
MRSILRLLLLMTLASPGAAAKVHLITFGRWTTAQWLPGTGAENAKPVAIKIRALMVDGSVKEYVLGAPHDVTDRLFAVRRVFRVNDSLPEDSAPRWQWQRGGFDPLYSAASWCRDYIAYCGVSDDGRKTSIMVAQISRRKPVLKKLLSNEGLDDDSLPDSACPAPAWQRGPVRVSFEPADGAKQTFAIRGHVVDLVNDAEEVEEGTK